MSKFIVNTPSLNVRNGPSADNSRIWVFTKGKVVDENQTSTNGEWKEVILGEIQGWVSSQYLQVMPVGYTLPDPGALLNDTSGINWFDWSERAMLISGSFEGNGSDWGNPVGNFDKAYLTCGLLGYTWKWNNQPPMVMEFVERHTAAALHALMPVKGQEYLDAVIAGEIAGAETVSSWSHGEDVIQPYHNELKAFWSSPEMKTIQKEVALVMMGRFAKRKALEGQEYFGLPAPLFSHFAYWFDQAVLNGTGETVAFERSEGVSTEEVFEWMRTAKGWTQASFNKNRNYWPNVLATANEVQKKMWILAYLRSQVASENGDTVTMCRRGSLALGSGWVNDSLRKFDLNNAPSVAAPATAGTRAAPTIFGGTTDMFLDIAEQNGLAAPALRLANFKLSTNPSRNPRYWAIVDFNRPSKEKRLFLIDTTARTCTPFLVAHGKGSDPEHSGSAQIFTNEPNTNASSLGIYRCRETYDGKHGLSLRLEGLEATNSNANTREIVFHSADYVSDAFALANGKLGRSWGCFAVDMSISEQLCKNLSQGSYVIAWKS